MSLIFTVGRRPGETVEADLARLPHLLVAGTTGSGKSVFLNSLLVDIMYSNTPRDLQLLLIDPKRVEFAAYRGSPHLLRQPVVNIEEAASALEWVRLQMDNRYRAIEATGERDLAGFNLVVEGDVHFPRLVIVIDELANLILSHRAVEEPLVAIASMGRAAGIHLVAATQRPSADVLTGLLRANIPARAAFATVTAMESRIILDQPGAERLHGKGDMFYRVGTELIRLQGRQVSDEQIKEVAA